MPIVQRYGDRKVDLAPLPGVRKQAHETALSEGAGVAQAEAQRAEAMGNFGSVGAQVGLRLYEQERRRADDIAMLSAQNRLARWENQRIYDPKNGALTVKGQDAFPLPEQINQEFDQVAGDIEKGLATDRQREAFARIKATRGISLDATVRRHVFGEMQRYEGQELQALVENAHSSAVANAMDPRRVGEELDRAVAAVKTHAPRLGLGPEQVQEQVTKVQSATHVGVIDRLLANDQTKAAQVYYEEAKGQISGEAMARVEKALEAGGLRADAQKHSDAILTAGGTLTEQRDKARAIEDPKLRDEVMQRIEHEAAVKDRSDREQEETTLKGVYSIVDQTHDVTKIPPTTWADLPGSARASLRAYADHLTRGVPVETDPPTYYALITQASEDPETFLKQNLLNYKSKLDEGSFQHFAQLQASIRSGDRKKADQDLGAFRTHDQILKDTLTQYGIDPTPKEGTDESKAVAQLRRMLDLRVQTLTEHTGKKPTNEDIQQTLDGLLSQNVNVPGSWWNIFPGGKSFFDQQKRVIDLTIGDVPTNERSLIEDALRRRGRPVSDATVLDLYLETRARRGK